MAAPSIATVTATYVSGLAVAMRPKQHSWGIQTFSAGDSGDVIFFCQPSLS